MHTMNPASIIVTVTATTASGCTFTFHHTAESGEWFLNSLLLAAIPAAHRVANIAGDDSDPYQMRAMYERLHELWEDENSRAGAVDYHRTMDDELRRIIDAAEGDG